MAGGGLRLEIQNCELPPGKQGGGVKGKARISAPLNSEEYGIRSSSEKNGETIEYMGRSLPKKGTENLGGKARELK